MCLCWWRYKNIAKLTNETHTWKTSRICLLDCKEQNTADQIMGSNSRSLMKTPVAHSKRIIKKRCYKSDWVLCSIGLRVLTHCPGQDQQCQILFVPKAPSTLWNNQELHLDFGLMYLVPHVHLYWGLAQIRHYCYFCLKKEVCPSS